MLPICQLVGPRIAGYPQGRNDKHALDLAQPKELFYNGYQRRSFPEAHSAKAGAAGRIYYEVDYFELRGPQHIFSKARGQCSKSPP